MAEILKEKKLQEKPEFWQFINQAQEKGVPPMRISATPQQAKKVNTLGKHIVIARLPRV